VECNDGEARLSMTARKNSLISLADVVIGARFLSRLPAFLRHRITPEQARAILRRRFEQREADFLAIAKLGIYQQAQSPYRQLLQLAGCEYGDLERLVRKDGVEEALRILYRQGIYLTVDEFKRRQPVVRGRATMPVDPSQLRNPLSAFHVPVRSSGSRGPGNEFSIDLAFVREHAVNMNLVLNARGGLDWLHGIWGVPGGMALLQHLRYCASGCPFSRWFSKVDPATPTLHPRYRWSGRALHWGAVMAGVRLPRPLFVPIENPLPIAHWMAEVLRSGHTPDLHTFASSAVRLCRAALGAGVDLRGARFTIGGEPVTAARLDAVRRVGAEALPQYASTESGGPIGYGCLTPEAPDDVHLYHDLHALIQPNQDGGIAGLPPSALFISSLRPTAPFILLNVSMGDQAVMTRRACGCPLERLGWATHLHTIRSYEKLTSGGMTFLDTDVIRVLEEVLPARFGGAPIDYQLLEDEADDGQPRLRLLVDPAVGPLDPTRVADAFLTAIGTGTGVERLTELLWRDAGLLRVERLVPRTTASGKILHLHLEHMPRAAPASRPEA
jgi:hypothetical protein